MDNANLSCLTIAELREFASFTPAEQRYIKRSLDVGLGRQDAFQLWVRDEEEHESIRGQYIVYRSLAALRDQWPDPADFEGLDGFMGTLLRISAYDLAQGRLTSFSAYRFLYERLLGAEVRPWLPSAFCGASALPQIRPQRRKSLLQSLSAAAATAPAWSLRDPAFYPQYVEA